MYKTLRAMLKYRLEKVELRIFFIDFTPEKRQQINFSRQIFSVKNIYLFCMYPYHLENGQQKLGRKNFPLVFGDYHTYNETE